MQVLRSCAVMALFGAAPAAFAVAPADGAPVAILTAPWAARESAVAIAVSTAADLAWVSEDGRAAIVVADGPLPLAQFYTAGALLVMRADASALCAGTDRADRRPGLSSPSSGEIS